jgi:hypothetical protein
MIGSISLFYFIFVFVCFRKSQKSSPFIVKVDPFQHEVQTSYRAEFGEESLREKRKPEKSVVTPATIAQAIVIQPKAKDLKPKTKYETENSEYGKGLDFKPSSERSFGESNTQMIGSRRSLPSDTSGVIGLLGGAGSDQTYINPETKDREMPVPGHAYRLKKNLFFIIYFTCKAYFDVQEYMKTRSINETSRDPKERKDFKKTSYFSEPNTSYWGSKWHDINCHDYE